MIVTKIILNNKFPINDMNNWKKVMTVFYCKKNSETKTKTTKIKIKRKNINYNSFYNMIIIELSN